MSSLFASKRSDFGRLPSSRGRRGRPARIARLVLVLAVLAALGLVLLGVFRTGPPPQLSLETSLPGLGRQTLVRAGAVESRRGLSRLQLQLEQGSTVIALDDREYQALAPWKLWGDRRVSDEIEIMVDASQMSGLSEGTAILRLRADRAPSWLRFPLPVVYERELPVRWSPPRASVVESTRNVRQGGSGLVVYRIGDTVVEHGVRIGEHWYGGRPLTVGGPLQISFFAAPYDLEDGSEVQLEVGDDLGNVGRQRFLATYRARPLKRSRIRLDQGFLEKVVPEISSRTPGLMAGDDLLARYLEINGGLRQRNGDKLRELAAASRSEMLWNGAFQQQPNSQVMDEFAARRTYLFDGEEVDTQDHLGLDLASTRRARVRAANDGVVAWADYFGIYGNTVVVDHGFGLMTLYAHLSSIEVSTGAEVEKGDEVGRSGETGLAGGDHLHFTVLVAGEPVDPREWFDASWIESHVMEPLRTAAPEVFAGAAEVGGG